LALLMAVATLVLVLAGVTAGLVALRGAHQSTWSSEVDVRLQSGLREGERLASAWLNAHATDAVLPPEGGGLVLVDDRFLLPSGEGRLSVVAYDGLGGIPACLAQRGSALRAALPASLTALTLPAIDPSQAEATAYLLDMIELPEGVGRFPAPPQSRGRLWRTAGVVGQVGTPAESGADPSLADSVSFRSDGRININTAPEPLLRAAYAALRLDGVEAVLERRRLLNASPLPKDGNSSADGLRLVAQSDRWQMLISVTWQDIRRSWWVDFTASSQSSSRVQRHDLGN
jgi:hypothetical protein